MKRIKTQREKLRKNIDGVKSEKICPIKKKERKQKKERQK